MPTEWRIGRSRLARGGARVLAVVVPVLMLVPGATDPVRWAGVSLWLLAWLAGWRRTVGLGAPPLRLREDGREWRVALGDGAFERPERVRAGWISPVIASATLRLRDGRLWLLAPADAGDAESHRQLRRWLVAEDGDGSQSPGRGT